MTTDEFMIYWIAGILVVIIFVILPAFIIIAIFRGIKKIFKKKRRDKQRAKLMQPVWDKVTTKEGESFYKFAGFSNYDTKAKWLPFTKKELLNESEFKIWKILQHNCQTNNIILCPKIQLEELISIDSDKEQIESWRRKVESIHIDYILCDNNMNILAGIELESNFKNEKFLDDTFFNIRIPLFWIEDRSGNYQSQVAEILKQLNPLITKLNEQQNKATGKGRFSGSNNS